MEQDQCSNTNGHLLLPGECPKTARLGQQGTAASVSVRTAR